MGDSARGLPTGTRAETDEVDVRAEPLTGTGAMTCSAAGGTGAAEGVITKGFIADGGIADGGIADGGIADGLASLRAGGMRAVMDGGCGASAGLLALAGAGGMIRA